jgi:putative serine/threonine protein kinase
LDYVSLYSPEAELVLCYPRSSRSCSSRIYLLEGIGVSELCSVGPTRLPGLHFKVLGKGHSSIVVAGIARGNFIVAVKARRIDGKRESLVGEGLALVKASRAGVAPKPLYYGDDIVVMEAIMGPRLVDLVGLHGAEQWVIIEALRAARALDTLGILHLELNRPWKNLLYTGACKGSKALIVDFESTGRGCGNVLSVLGGLARLPGLRDLIISKEMRAIERLYKRTCAKNVYEEIERMVIEALEKREG